MWTFVNCNNFIYWNSRRRNKWSGCAFQSGILELITRTCFSLSLFLSDFFITFLCLPIRDHWQGLTTQPLSGWFVSLTWSQCVEGCADFNGSSKFKTSTRSPDDPITQMDWVNCRFSPGTEASVSESSFRFIVAVNKCKTFENFLRRTKSFTNFRK